jgi:hypothetical protein
MKKEGRNEKTWRKRRGGIKFGDIQKYIKDKEMSVIG